MEDTIRCIIYLVSGRNLKGDLKLKDFTLINLGELNFLNFEEYTEKGVKFKINIANILYIKELCRYEGE